MNAQFFVIQVATGNEGRFIKRVENDPALSDNSSSTPFRLWWPRRKLFIRRKGKRIATLKSLFPGYLILETPQIPEWLYRGLRTTDGFVRFLKSNANIQPLAEGDLELVRHFLKLGEVVKESKVTFDINNRIVVQEGPLKGLEGRIVKINKRKQRAKVKLDLYEQGFLIDLAFEVIQTAASGPAKTNGESSVGKAQTNRHHGEHPSSKNESPNQNSVEHAS